MRWVLFLSNRLQTAGDAYFQEISAKQWYLLCYVDGFRENPPTLTQLAAEMGTSHQNTKQMAVKLERKGYLRLLPDADDRRKTRVCVTEEGQKLFQKYQEGQNWYIDELFQNVSPEQEQAALETLELLVQKAQITIVQKSKNC